MTLRGSNWYFQTWGWFIWYNKGTSSLTQTTDDDPCFQIWHHSRESEGVTKCFQYQNYYTAWRAFLLTHWSHKNRTAGHEYDLTLVFIKRSCPSGVRFPLGTKHRLFIGRNVSPLLPRLTSLAQLNSAWMVLRSSVILGLIFETGRYCEMYGRSWRIIKNFQWQVECKN